MTEEPEVDREVVGLVFKDKFRELMAMKSDVAKALSDMGHLTILGRFLVDAEAFEESVRNVLFSLRTGVKTKQDWHSHLLQLRKLKEGVAQHEPDDKSSQSQ